MPKLYQKARMTQLGAPDGIKVVCFTHDTRDIDLQSQEVDWDAKRQYKACSTISNVLPWKHPKIS